MPRPRRAKIISAHAQAQLSTKTHQQSQDARIPLSQKTSNIRRQTSQTGEEEKEKGQKTSLSGQARFIANSRETPALVDIDSPQTQPAAKLDVPKRSQHAKNPRASRPATRKASISISSIQPTPNKVVHDPSTNLVERVTDSFPSLPQDTQLSAPPSSFKAHGTPSFLSISNFRKRPRQPSLLRMIQKSMGAQTGIGEDSADESSSVLTLDDGLLDDTLEGLGATTHAQSDETQTRDDTEVLVQSSGSRKRKRDARNSDTREGNAAEFDSSPPPTPSSERRQSNNRTKRRRRSGPVEDATANASRETVTVVQSSLPDHVPVHSPSPRRHRASRRVTGRPQQLEPTNPSYSPTEAASPVSSSSPTASSSPHQLEPETQNNRVDQKLANKRRPPPLKTATLQSLLPRRRLRLPDRGNRTDEFEILDSSDEARGSYGDLDAGEEDDDVDVLSKPSTRRPRGSLSRVVPKAKSKPKTHGKANNAKVSKSGATRRTGVKRKAKRPLTSIGNTVESSPTEIRRGSMGKTYGKQRQDEDKENSQFENLNDGNETEEDVMEATNKIGKKSKSTTSKSKELEAAAKKFKEVDEWELSFESCDLTGGSSPWR